MNIENSRTKINNKEIILNEFSKSKECFKILQLGIKLFKNKKSFKIQFFLFFFNNLIYVLILAWIFKSTEISLLGSLLFFAVLAMLWYINIRYNLQYSKELFTKRKDIFKDLTEIFADKDGIREETIKSARSWYNKSKIMDIFNLGAYSCSFFIYFLFNLWMIFQIIYFIHNFNSYSLNKIILFLIYPYCLTFILSVSLLFLFSYFEMYKNRFYWISMDILREKFYEIQKKKNQIIDYSKYNYNISELYDIIKNQLTKIKILYNLEDIKILFRPELNLNRKRVLKYFNQNKQFDIITIITEYKDFLKFLVNINKQVNVIDDFYFLNLQELFNESKIELLNRIKNLKIEHEYKIIDAAQLEIKSEDNTLIAFSMIMSFEYKLRDFLEKNLKKHYGENWWEYGIPSNAKKEAEHRFNNIKEMNPAKSIKKIDFLTFMDYYSIITTDNKNHRNWSKIFESFFLQKQTFSSHFEELNHFRNDIMHCRFDAENLEQLKIVTKELLTLIKK